MYRAVNLCLVAALALAPLAAASAQTSGAILQVPQFHRDDARTGQYVVPLLTYLKAPNLHSDPNFKPPALDGVVAAQPLFWTAPKRAKSDLIVVTENNTVYALNAVTGALDWKTSLGASVPGSALGTCGSRYDPAGVTGTPVIDVSGGNLYLAGLINSPSGPRAVFSALHLSTGKPLPGFPVDIQNQLGAAFNIQVEGQHSALAISNGRVYAGYSAQAKDCGAYNGMVVSVPIVNPGVSSIQSWSARAGGGIWGAAGIINDGDSVLVATGNTRDLNVWGGGEAVLRLPLDLAFAGRNDTADFFTPAYWKKLDSGDLDLGSTAPVPFSMPNSTPSNLVLAMGKGGEAYLLDADNLGGLGGQIAKFQVSLHGVAGSIALYPDVPTGGFYAAFTVAGSDASDVADHCPKGQGGRIAALRILPGSPPTMRLAWCQPAAGFGGPIVTMTGPQGHHPIVWLVNQTRLLGFRGDTGAPLFTGGGPNELMAKVLHFTAPIAAYDRIYVVGANAAYAFIY